jgi:hypothetical protein
MISEFLNLNKKKIVLGIKWTSIIFTSIVIGIFIWGHFNEQMSDTLLAVTVLIFASVIFPVFIMALGTIQEYLVFRKTSTLINNYPFNELTNLGFKKTLINENSKWTMTQLRLEGRFNDYPIETELEKTNFKFIALVNLDKISKDHLKHLKREMGDGRIEMDWFGVSLIYNLARDRVTSIEQIKGDLKRMTDYLKRENLEVDSESGSA